MLREAGHDLRQSDWINVIRTVGIVLISSPDKPRVQWNLGRVTKLLHGNDGKVRTVRAIRPDRSQTVYSIELLYPLELSATPVKYNLNNSNDSQDETVIPRLHRAAAIRCRECLRSN